MDVLITNWVAIHEGGTKFYELVLVEDTARTRSVCVRRWGKEGVRIAPAGGEVMVDTGDGKAAFAKMKRQKGRGGYDETGPAFMGALGGLCSESRYQSVLDEATFRARADSNWGRGTADTVLSRLKGMVDVDATLEMDIDDDVVEELPEPEVAAPVKRDENWGSW